MTGKNFHILKKVTFITIIILASSVIIFGFYSFQNYSAYSDGYYIFVKKVDPTSRSYSDSVNNSRYINLTQESLNSCPLLAKLIKKAQDQPFGTSVNQGITSSEEKCLSSALYSQSSHSYTLFNYNSDFFYITFAVS